MEKREVGRKSTRTVPVIIENHENATKKTKFMVPTNCTAGQLVNILRSRMHLRPSHPVYLFLKSKKSPVLMSKSIGHLHHKHRDEKGLLRLIHTGQASFGFRGNIRAIRFRQKWIESLPSLLHQVATGSQSISAIPPTYFPLEPPSTVNSGGPLDVDDLIAPIEDMPVIEDFFHDYLEENAYIEIGDSDYISDTAGSSQSSANYSQSSANYSHSSTATNSSISSAMTDWADPWLSSGFAESIPWLLSATTNSDVENSGQTSDVENSGQTSDVENSGQTSDVENSGQTSDVKNSGQTSGVENSGQTSGVENSGQTSGVENSGQTSGVENSGQTSGVRNFDQFSDVRNSAQTSSVGNSLVSPSHEDVNHAPDLDPLGLQQILSSFHQYFSTSSALNSQSPNVPNPEIPSNIMSLYDSDSEFYESDDMDD